MEDRAGGERQSLLKTKSLLKFQIDDVLTAYPVAGHMFGWDCGMGKSVGALALSVLLFENGKIDLVLVVCERNKRREWREDFQLDTDLSVRVHHGGNRHTMLTRHGLPQVLITTYETAKADVTRPKGPASFLPGPLLTVMSGKRVLVIYDESTKLKNRSSANHKAHKFMLESLRKKAATKVIALTATPLEIDYEDGYNQMRLVVPNYMPSVAEFGETYIRYRDAFDRPVYDNHKIQEFTALTRPHLSRRRKTDPDVIEQFPPLVEEYRYVEMPASQREFYRMAEDMVLAESLAVPGRRDMGAWMLLRQIAGHPASIIHSAAKENGSHFAKEIVESLGEEHLRSLGSGKTAELLAYLDLVVGAQQAKAMVFSFFGQSVLKELERVLVKADVPVFTYHGGKGTWDNEISTIDFKNIDGGAVLLASDAGAQGINIPEATYVVEYESALTHSRRIQRRDRAHRITSKHGPVTCMTFIAEGTIEEAIFASVLKRNEKHDIFVGDLDAEEEFISAADRRLILAEARDRYQTRIKTKTR